MTEEEARTRWCPFTRVNHKMSSINRRVSDDGDPLLLAGAACVASDCMAWRWHGSKDKPSGHCGLAGNV